MPYSTKIIQRFWSKVNKNGPIHPIYGQCWIWIAGKDIKDGYGAFYDGMRQLRAHRFSFALLNKIPNGLFVLHHCDNPICVNPSHLFLGTQLDNMRDKSKKGRQTRGEQQHEAKLTEKDVRLIRKLHALKNVKYAQLARKYNLHITTIISIVKRESWKHVK